MFLASALLCAFNEQRPSASKEATPGSAIHSLPAGFTREAAEDSTEWEYRYEDLLFTGKSDAPFTVILVGQPDPWAQDSTLRDTLFHDERFLIRGDMHRMNLAYRRYESRYKPELFAVPLYKGHLAEPRIGSDPNARGFRTMIRKACR